MIAYVIAAKAYLNGWEVESSIHIAATYIDRAMNDGGALKLLTNEELCDIAMAYNDGKEVRMCPKEAAELFRIAVERGYPKARYHLGMCF